MEYDSYKKKYETSLNNYSIFNEHLKKMDAEIKENLSVMDERLNLGYDRSLMMTSEKI